MKVGVIGAGTMGSGIALSCLYAGLPVILYDLFPAARDKASGYIIQFLKKKDQAEAFQLLALTDNLSDLSDCTVIIEAVSEDEALKQSIFQQLDAICPENTVFATNTSTLSVTRIAGKTAHPQRVVGMHFFNPAPVMKLVEIIRAVQTDDAIVSTAVELAETLGKTPVLAHDSPGFLVNRVARPFYLESLRIVTEGIATPAQVDTIMALGGHFRMGPFQLMDLIGLDVNLASSLSVYEQTFYESRFRPSLLQAKMVAANHLGRKTGRGFYVYADGATTFKLPDVPQKYPHSYRLYVTSQSALAQHCQAVGFILQDSPHGAEIALADDADNISENNISKETLLLVDINRVASLPPAAVAYDGGWMPDASAITLSPGGETNLEQRQRAEAFMNGLGLAVIWLDQSTPGHIFSRVIAQIVNEAAFAVGEGVADQDTVDRAMQLGMNFPHGAFAWGAALGYRQIVRVVDGLFDYYHEERYRTAPLLRRLAAHVSH